MRKITEQTLKAFLNRKNCRLGGRSDYSGKQRVEIKDDTLYIHENAIAKLVNGELYVRIVVGSNTTRERLHGFRNFGYDICVNQQNFDQYINGEKVTDLYKWYHIKKI